MAIDRCCPVTSLFAGDLSPEAALFKALGDPARLAIVATLARAENAVCVCDFTAGLALNQSTVSHHLKILRDAGIVASERRGTWVYYTLVDSMTTRIESAICTALPRALVTR